MRIMKDANIPLQFVNFAVVGCGNIGSRHLAVVDAEPRARLVALCDIDEGQRKKYGELYKDTAVYATFDDLLRESKAEIINICTPHALHAPMAIAAAEAGKHILVEKPMALCAKDCDRMIDAAQKNNVRLMVVKQNRYNVPIALTRKALDEDRLGKVYMVSCRVLWNRHLDYYRTSNWRGRRDLEGGALHTQVSHFIDLMIWWFGDIVDASTQLSTRRHEIDIEDCGNAMLTFESGVMGNLMWSVALYNKNYEGSITIVGEKGTIKIGGQYLNTIEHWDVESYPLPEGMVFTDKPNLYGKYQGSSSNHDKVVHDVVAALLHERHHVVNGDEGRRSIEAIEMIYRSAAWLRYEHKRVPIGGPA